MPRDLYLTVGCRAQGTDATVCSLHSMYIQDATKTINKQYLSLASFLMFVSNTSLNTICC